MPDGLITFEDLKEIFDIQSALKAERFNRAFAAAGRRMREWVGDEAYEDALLEEPTDATRQADLEYAEAHLVMHFAVLGVNTAMRKGGILVSEKAEAGTVLTYLSPGQVATLQQQYLEEAQSIASPYLLSDGTVDGLGVVSALGFDEGTTRSCC